MRMRLVLLLAGIAVSVLGLLHAHAAAKVRLEQQLRVQQAYAEQVKDVKPTPPGVTLSDRMTLVRSGGEIGILHLSARRHHPATRHGHPILALVA